MKEKPIYYIPSRKMPLLSEWKMISIPPSCLFSNGDFFSFLKEEGIIVEDEDWEMIFMGAGTRLIGEDYKYVLTEDKKGVRIRNEKGEYMALWHKKGTPFETLNPIL